MDGLSGVASGMAVISLSLQLVQSVNTIKNQIRHVKNAPAEVKRLSSVLGSLGALLDDVRGMMEVQSSSGVEAVPMPSMTIFDCLKGCEQQIQLLSQMMRQYEHQDAGSKIATLLRNAKIGFKAKDITDIEDRIQREINRLNMALTTNNTKQLHALHVFVSKHRLVADGHIGKQTLISNGAEMMNPDLSTNVSSMAVSLSAEVHHSNSGRMRTITQWSPSLARFGIHRQEITRTKRRSRDASNKPSLQDEDELHEEVYLWACRILGTGIRWSRRHLYGTVSSSISTYPVVAQFSKSVWYMMKVCKISDLEQAFRKGGLHPYTRDSRGESLYHLASFYSRSDICQFLEHVGLNVDTDCYGDHPILQALYYSAQADAISVIDTTRFFLQDYDLADSRSFIEDSYMVKYLSMQVSLWLWENRAEFTYGQLTSTLELFCVRRFVAELQDPDKVPFVIKYLKGDMASALRNGLLRAPSQILKALYTKDELKDELWSPNSSFSFDIGRTFLDLLTTLDIDIGACAMEVFGNSLGGMLYLDNKFIRSRWLVFEQTAEYGWRLGWDWLLNQEASGYLVVSEFEELSLHWNFAEYMYNISSRRWKAILSHQNARFEHRQAAKARKELARMGLKKPQSRMPGSWIQ